MKKPFGLVDPPSHRSEELFMNTVIGILERNSNTSLQNNPVEDIRNDERLSMIAL